MSAVPVLDRARLDALCGGDPALEGELVAMLLDDAAPLVRELQNAVDQRERDAVREHAHGLKGIAGNVGAPQLAAAAAALEAAAATGASWADVERAFARAVAAVHDVAAATR